MPLCPALFVFSNQCLTSKKRSLDFKRFFFPDVIVYTGNCIIWGWGVGEYGKMLGISRIDYTVKPCIK